MGARRNVVEEADRRGRRQLAELLSDLVAARHAAGLSQTSVAQAIGRSRQLLAVWEAGRVVPTPIDLARWGSVIGIDVPIRGYAGGSPLRDSAQLQVLGRFQVAVGGGWAFQAELAVTNEALDRRAIDLVLSGPVGRVGAEAITRLTDAQAQVRAAMLKQAAAGLDRMVLVLADTRHNRAALAAAEPTLRAAFPLASNTVLSALRAGRLPEANGIVVI